MISYEVYKVLHVASVFLFLMLATTHLALAKPSKGLAAGIGISAMLILVAGFGLMARLGIIREWPIWLIGKMVIWLTLTGGAHMIARRVPNPLKIGLPFLWLGASLALYFVMFKPGAV